MRQKFFLKSFVNLLLVMIVPMILLGAVMVGITGRYIRQDIAAKNQALLEQSAQITRLVFQSFDTVNLMISSDSTSARAVRRITSGTHQFNDQDLKNLNNLNNNINSIIASSQYIDSVYIYMRNSEAFYSSQDRIVPIDSLEDRDWLEQIASQPGRQGFTNRQLYRKPADGQEREVVSVYRSMYSGVGTAVVNIDIRRLREDMGKYLVYEGQSMHLTDSSSSIYLTGDRPIGWADMSAMLAEPSGEFVYDLGGLPCLVTRLPIDRYGWEFVSVAPVSALYRLQREMVSVITLAVGCCILLGIGISIVSAHRSYRSISGIIDAIEIVHQGGEAPPAPPKNQDVYTYIIHNVIHHGLLKDYMEMQLSEKRYMLQTLEMKALQYQINPHFLVNTLKGIYWKSVRENGMDSPVARMTENLLDITGYYLSDPAATVTLREEILHTRSYTDILIDRHGGELEVAWDSDPALEDAVCKRLFLQPFIENAFYHGIRPSGRPGRIKIRIRRRGNDIVASVVDNGVGMSPDKVAAIRDKLKEMDLPARHIGIYNPHRRIVLAFGADYGVCIHSKAGFGTRIRVHFPYRVTEMSE